MELVAIAVSLSEPPPDPRPRAAADAPVERSRRRVRFEQQWHETEVVRASRERGRPSMAGPVLELPETTLVLPPGWAGEVDEHGTFVAERR